MRFYLLHNGAEIEASATKSRLTKKIERPVPPKEPHNDAASLAKCESLITSFTEVDKTINQLAFQRWLKQSSVRKATDVPVNLIKHQKDPEKSQEAFRQWLTKKQAEKKPAAGVLTTSSKSDQAKAEQKYREWLRQNQEKEKLRKIKEAEEAQRIKQEANERRKKSMEALKAWRSELKQREIVDSIYPHKKPWIDIAKQNVAEGGLVANYPPSLFQEYDEYKVKSSESYRRIYPLLIANAGREVSLQKSWKRAQSTTLKCNHAR